jgi:hypothetical protein
MIRRRLSPGEINLKPQLAHGSPVGKVPIIMPSASVPAIVRRIQPEHLRLCWLGGFMLLVIIASLRIGEHYPFSNFPMYGNPSRVPVDYYFLTDADGVPLPTTKLTGDTAPKIKKRLNTSLKEWADAHPKIGRTNMPAEIRAGITRNILDTFVQQSKNRGTPLPDRVQLWQGKIYPSPMGFYETFTMEAEN